MSDSDYFAQREQSALQGAERASNPAVRDIHLTLASAYRERRGEGQGGTPRGSLRVA